MYIMWSINASYIKTINGPDEKPIKINCDLVVHSRGLAIEMKKFYRSKKRKLLTETVLLH